MQERQNPAIASPYSKITYGCQRHEKRRGGDSNPRYDCSHTGFRNQPDQPLRHLSYLLMPMNLRSQGLRGRPLFRFIGVPPTGVRGPIGNSR